MHAIVHGTWYKGLKLDVTNETFFFSLLEKRMLSALKVKRFQPDFANSENTTKFKETSEFRQDLSALKFA
jgi:hypothetical protein